MQPTTDSTFLDLACSSCGEPHAADVIQTVCRRCGRALLARYDLERAAPVFHSGEFRSRVASMWRYAEVLPIFDAAAIVSLGEGMTPLDRAPRLGDALGLRRVYVKDEGLNPTGSFKARGLSVAMSKAVELGVEDIALPTAGNAGGAAAAYGARAGITTHVAMPKDAPRPMIDEVRTYGGDLELVDGLISDAGKWIGERAREYGWLDISTMKEPYRLEGKKTLGYELWEQLGKLPDVILYPTGGGTGLIGMWRAFSELEEMGLIDGRRPRMVAVQSSGCAPVPRAFAAGAERTEHWHNAATLAPGLRVPKPFADDLILATLRDSDGDAVAVDDGEIVADLKLASAAEGIDFCPEGAAAVAALRRLVAAGRVDRDELIVVFNTATGLKHPELRGV
ncbi:MAG: threonine synthase [Thermoanaerobaculia bacterium]